MATNHLKFINEVETKAKSLSGDSVRRSFDALDEFRTENARLRRELIEAREEIRQLREQVDRRPTPQVAAPVPALAPAPPPAAPEQPEDGAAIRFSLLELG
jgi:hypothetical protein